MAKIRQEYKKTKSKHKPTKMSKYRLTSNEKRNDFNDDDDVDDDQYQNV